MSKTRLARRIFKGFAVLAMLGVLGVGVLLGWLWLERRTEITLPTPTGPFAVAVAGDFNARSAVEELGDSRVDALTEAGGPGERRSLVVFARMSVSLRGGLGTDR